MRVARHRRHGVGPRAVERCRRDTEACLGERACTLLRVEAHRDLHLIVSAPAYVHATPEQQSACLREAGVCFCFAVRHHPAARHAAVARQALGFPTIFNLLGPLTNPAGAARQVTGVYREDMAEKVAHALAALGCERAMVVHSEDGLDEISITAGTHAWDVLGGRVARRFITLAEVESMGLSRATMEDVRAGDLTHASRMAEGVLRGDSSPAQGMVLLSAGAALLVGGAVDTLAEGVDAAAGAVRDGRAMAALERLRVVSHALVTAG